MQYWMLGSTYHTLLTMSHFTHHCRDWENTHQATVKRLGECSVQQGGRQVENDWTLSWNSNGKTGRHCWEVSTRSTNLPCRDVRDLARASLPSPHLGCHHWCCGVSGRGAARKRTEGVCTVHQVRESDTDTIVHLLHGYWSIFLLCSSLVKGTSNFP